MPNAELVIHGTFLTVDESQPTAEALAVIDGRIAAVGSRADVEPFIGPDTEVLDIGDGCVMPGLVEARGHPLMEAIALSDRLVDIRPVTIPDADDVVAAIKSEVAKRGADGAYLNGWDPLLQNGLPEPTLEWLNGMASSQLGTQGVLQLGGDRAERLDPRHCGPQGREVRPRRIG